MGINKSYLLFILLVLSLVSIDTFSEDKIPTIKEYMNDTENKYDSYIYGLENGLEWAAEYYFRKHNVEIYCKPGNIELPVSKLKTMINNTISNKPGFFKKYENEQLLGLALRNGYIEEFPCQ
tara:strand:- start:416 stop:781 length:366 start_codon:yes stop_codon:yes gene_type:complete